MDITVVLFYQPIFNLMVLFYRLFSENLGVAIILIAILSRLITLPLIIKQKKSIVKNKEFSDKVKEIKTKFKNNKEEQDKELIKLQSEYLPGQIAGCLPIILQLIFFINIYNVIFNLVVKGASSFNSLAYSFVPTFPEGYSLNYTFFGLFDLGKHPYDFAGSTFINFLPYLILMLLVGITQYFSMKITMNMSLVKPIEKTKSKEKGKEKSGNAATEDFAEILQQSTRQTMVLFPILYTFLSYNFQAGLALYWIVQSGFVIIQQPFLNFLEGKGFSFKVKDKLQQEKSIKSV